MTVDMKNSSYFQTFILCIIKVHVYLFSQLILISYMILLMYLYTYSKTC